MTFARIFLSEGRIALREEVKTETLAPRGLESAANLLKTLRIAHAGNAAGVMHAAVRTGQLAEIQLGIAHLFKTAPPAIAEHDRRVPDHAFTIRESEAAAPFMLTSVLPSEGLDEGDRLVVSLLLRLSGWRDEGARGEALMLQAVNDVVKVRPALVSVLTSTPKDRECLAYADTLARHVGACILGAPEPARVRSPEPATAARAGASTISVRQITLEQIVELNRRSALLMMRRAQGPIDQAEAWNAWVESCRADKEAAFALLVLHPSARSVTASLMPGMEVRWWELPAGGRHRFVGTHGGLSFYLIPVDGKPVPTIGEIAEAA